MIFQEDLKKGLNDCEIDNLVKKSLAKFNKLNKILIIHPDSTRNDFTDKIVKAILNSIEEREYEHIHFLNACGTHGIMTKKEFLNKLGLETIGKNMFFFNHIFNDKSNLRVVGEVPSSFISKITNGNLKQEIPVTINKMILENYDVILTIGGTVPHEAAGFSGGLKIFFPGVSGSEVIDLFHWVGALIGIPNIIGTINNYVREVINVASKFIFKVLKKPVLCFNMIYDGTGDKVRPLGLYIDYGFKGFINAYKKAASASFKIHIKYLDKPIDIAVQEIPKYYSSVWTAAGKSSSKLQRKGVIKGGGAIIIYGPHIKCFHSNKYMDEMIKLIGYHCKDFVLDFLKKNPEFSRNIASHVINVNGPGYFDRLSKKEISDLKIILATSISKDVCESVNLGYIDHETLRREDFQTSEKLWIKEGGRYLYNLKGR
ncbi:MAG: lactate racemase domain-containing protein [Actinomycetota bacterium]|nr:lactate racemase domain-containing protein [Actinomycetota bacterium]